MKLKLHRDKVISIVKGRQLVGVYVIVEPKNNGIYYENKEKTGGKLLNIKKPVNVMLAEMSPTKADKIIKLWNTK